MTENEQIEEMAKAIEEARVKALDTTNSMNYGFGGWYAKELYSKGYRKVERGEWIEEVHDWDFGDYTDYRCSICRSREQNKRHFCPECGADMRGD